MSARPVVVIGSGGHASVLMDVLSAAGCSVEGVITLDHKLWGKTFGGVPVLGGDEALDGRDPKAIALANGVGSVRAPTVRARVFEDYRGRGFRFPAIVHPSAVVAPSVELSDGVQIWAGCVVQAGTVLGLDALVNTGARVDHHCVVGDHVHVAPGAILCGEVHVGARSHIGAGAVVIQGIQVGKDVVVGAGATVTAAVPDGLTVVGVPAREVRRR